MFRPRSRGLSELEDSRYRTSDSSTTSNPHSIDTSFTSLGSEDEFLPSHHHRHGKGAATGLGSSSGDDRRRSRTGSIAIAARRTLLGSPARRLICWMLALLTIGYLLLGNVFTPQVRFVVILPTNIGGGVLGWKGPQEWAVEKVSIQNKRAYVRRHNYGLAVADMSMQRKYAHEWRESWEKVDTIKRVMRENPHAEWFWWLDLSTYIMEPDVSLQKHIFDDLENNVVRNLSAAFNPSGYRDDVAFVDYTQPINMVIPQDCGGFNLGSFFLRRSEWTERLLDVWWDPVFYEQKHMEWAHKEQDAFAELYTSQAWIRSSTAFIGNRRVNAYPPGACQDYANDRQFFYGDRDFCVNMAGCQFGRNCYDEMMFYKDLSRTLNRRKFWLL